MKPGNSCPVFHVQPRIREMADQSSLEVRSFISQLIHQLIRQIENSNPSDTGDIDGVLFRADWLYNCLVRYVGSYDIGDDVLQLVRDSKDMLQVIADTQCINQQSFTAGQLHSGNCGRPRFVITKEQLEFLLERGFRLKEVAKIFGVHLSTIERRCRDYGLSATQTFSYISDQALDCIVEEIIRSFPSFGYRRMTGALLSRGIKVQQTRVRESMRRVHPDGVLFRALTINTVNRRKYSVSSPLALWHVDGNHKLIRWRIVIHGGIDGFSRMIVYLKASSNNRASTVLKSFLDAVEEFGLPSRVRSDKGGENVDIAKYMLDHPLRGPDRGSHITGRSVHNQRIERLWRDLYFGCTHLFYSLFCAMEDAGILNPSSEAHLYALHYIYLPRLNRHLSEFVNAHARAPISTEHNKSPLQLWISGLLNVWNSNQLVAVEQSMPEDDLALYGVDWDGPAPSSLWHGQYDDSVEPVEVPAVPANVIDSERLQVLNQTVDPLQDSDEHGVDLYVNALHCMLNNT